MQSEVYDYQDGNGPGILTVKYGNPLPDPADGHIEGREFRVVLEQNDQRLEGVGVSARIPGGSDIPKVLIFTLTASGTTCFYRGVTRTGAAGGRKGSGFYTSTSNPSDNIHFKLSLIG